MQGRYCETRLTCASGAAKVAPAIAVHHCRRNGIAKTDGRNGTAPSSRIGWFDVGE